MISRKDSDARELSRMQVRDRKLIVGFRRGMLGKYVPEASPAPLSTREALIAVAPEGAKGTT